MDRASLAKTVDALIEKYQLSDMEQDLKALREQKIQELDDLIGMEIFGSLSRAQQMEIRKLFESDEESPDAIRSFFENAGVDVSQKIEDAIRKFDVDFLGGKNE